MPVGAHMTTLKVLLALTQECVHVLTCAYMHTGGNACGTHVKNIPSLLEGFPGSETQV